MTPPGRPLRAACITLLTTGPGLAALVSAGVPAPASGGVTVEPHDGQALPYVEVQGTTDAEGERSNVTRTTSSTITMVVRAERLAQAEAIADVVVAQLARRVSVSGQTTVLGSLDLYGPAYRDAGIDAGPQVWSLPVRLRYALFQSASPTE